MPSLEADLPRFEAFDAQVVGISVDSRHSLNGWAKTLGGISYPLLADFWPHGGVITRYGVLKPEGFSQRANFIVDKDGIIRYIDVHDFDEQPDNEDLLDALRRIQADHGRATGR